MTQWPAREANDVGWAYMAIIGDKFSEAVSVIDLKRISSTKFGQLKGNAYNNPYVSLSN